MNESLSVSYEKQRRIFKIIVIGDSDVGKTCLTYRFCDGKFPSRTEATIGVDFREKQVIVDNEPIKVNLRKIIKIKFNKSINVGFLLCFSEVLFQKRF